MGKIGETPIKPGEVQIIDSPAQRGERRRLPALTDDPLGGLPAQIRAHMFEAHFQGPKDKNPIAVKVDENMLTLIGDILLDLKAKGGIPWLTNQSELVREGLWLVCMLYEHYAENPPEEMRSVLLAEMAEAQAKTWDIMHEKLVRTVALRSKQCQMLLGDTDAVLELRAMLTGFVDQVSQMGGFWRTKYCRAVLDDRHLIQALKRYDLEERVVGLLEES